MVNGLEAGDQGGRQVWRKVLVRRNAAGTAEPGGEQAFL